MKREGAIVGLFVISVFLIGVISSTSMVSANWMGDTWSKITGKPIDENITEDEGEEEVDPEPKPCPTVVRPLCPDQETPCPEEKDEFGCPVWDCDSCGEKPPLPCMPTPELCPDGKTLCPTENDEQGCTHFNCDDCEKDEPPGPPPKECEEGKIKYYECSDGTKIPECECEGGGWVCKISVKEDCPDVDPDPGKCAAKIKITFNKEVYTIGDPVKIIIEIFDSQGNHLPNYAFYGQMYDDRWHTPDFQKTDDKGYFIHTGIAEKPGGGVSEIKFKLYTKETSSCGSVEDIAEVKFEPEDCGIGGCGPDLVCTDEIRNCGGDCAPCSGNGEIFYPCSGCESENKCYPYGHRKAGNYCSDIEDVFTDQLVDNQICENNFECKTNLCIDGSCVSSNTWNKFLKWFSKMFGGGGEEPSPVICSEFLIEEDIGDYEYKQTLYGPGDAQVPIYSEDGEQREIVKCCAAQYMSSDGRENMGVVCPLDSKKEVENSVKWLLVKNTRLTLGEHKGERVLNDQDKVVAWTSKAYVVATGTGDTLFDTYLERYPNDFDLTEDDIPYVPRIPDLEPKSFVFCTEEDKRAAKECDSSGGAGQSDPSTFEGTKESKENCKVHGEGCCEVYSGCIMPDANCEEIKIVGRDECYWHVARLKNDVDLCEKISASHYKDKCLRDVTTTTQDSSTCEKIDDSENRNKCYVNVAEKTGNANICDKVDDSSLREKCYFWVAGKTGESDNCIGIADVYLQAMCYVNLAEQVGDANICKKIGDVNIIDKCLRDLAIQINDRSICEKVLGDRAKQECLDSTS